MSFWGHDSGQTIVGQLKVNAKPRQIERCKFSDRNVATFECHSPSVQRKTRQAGRHAIRIPQSSATSTPTRKLGSPQKSSASHGVVAFEGVADVVGRDSAETADAPVIAFEFDDGGRHDPVGFARIKDQR